MLQLPVTTNGNSEIEVPIDGVVYTLKYNYNTRNKRLFLSIFDDETPLIEGLRLVDNGAPIINYAIKELNGAQLEVLQILDGTGFATLGNVGIDEEFILLYVTEEELESL